MEAVLDFVKKLLSYLGEFKAAGIIDIIKQFFASLG